MFLRKIKLILINIMRCPGHAWDVFQIPGNLEERKGREHTKAQLYNSQFVMRQQLQTDRYCRFFHLTPEGQKIRKFWHFRKNNGHEDWESLIRPGLSKIWLWETIFEVCTVTVLMCSSQLSLIKLPLGNLMKLETTLKACWSTDCWSASDRNYFRSIFWPEALFL